MTTSLSGVGALRRVAVEMIAEVWDVLEGQHVVPCSRFRPYVQAGRDYESDMLAGGPAFGRFTATLQTLYPAWFEAPQGQPPRWPAENLAFNFVDACIAELSRKEETGKLPGDAVEGMVLELIDYLDSANSRICCARRVCHLMTEDRQELTIAGVTVLDQREFDEVPQFAVRAPREWFEVPQIAELIPMARSAFNGESPFSLAPPEATLVSYATGPDPFELPEDLDHRIDDLLLAIHLLWGATTANIYQVTGETTAICRYPARVDVVPYQQHLSAVRPAVLSPARVEPVERLLALYVNMEHRVAKEVVHGLEMAIFKFEDSFSPRDWYEKIVDLATALEASLSGNDKADVTLRICTRAAHLLSTDTDSPQVIFGDVKALYDIRSSLVHGAVITQKDLEKLLRGVSCVSECRIPHMRIELAVDRLRDLVRRSILVRLVLNSEGRWPLRGDPPRLDQLLADASAAEEWRNAWHQGVKDLGAPEAAQPASPLRDSIIDDYPGKTG